MGKSIKFGIYALLICFCVIFSAQSQVTIGTLSQPLKGVLLDLKESDASNGDANSEKGLMLPRVTLTNTKSLSPILSGEDLNDATLISNYAGLIVYNVSTAAPFEKGLYSWDGTQWNLISPVSASNGLTLSNDTVKLGGDLTQATTVNLNSNNLILDTSTGGNIGIGTSSPAATLDIAGTARINVPAASQSTSDQYLVVDNTGNILARPSVLYRVGFLNDTAPNAPATPAKDADMSSYDAANVMDFYFIDRDQNITLPKPSSTFTGKLIRFYIYGGIGSKVTFTGVDVPQNWTSQVNGFSYSLVNSGAGQTSAYPNGKLSVTDGGLDPNNSSNSKYPNVRFRFIDIICDGSNWWVNNI